jgi:uncharacterized YigZ family protein
MNVCLVQYDRDLKTGEADSLEIGACSFIGISACSEAEMVEKKSRFICRLVPIENPLHIDNVLHQIRVDYPAAKHYCWGCLIRGENGLLERYSDDGEPSGTAGLPILSLLKNSHLQNIMAVVVRYFGGTLLGTGGLVRAYTQTVQLALGKAQVVHNIYCQRLRIEIDYNLYGLFEKNLRCHFVLINDIQFTTSVTIDGWLPVETEHVFQHELMEVSGGKAIIERLQHDFIPDLK